ncbi:hypothetical protein U9227_24875 [Escherichia coli]
MLSWLHNNNVIFPSVDVIERTLAEAVTLADRSVFSALTAQLGKQHKSALDSLLISEGEQPSRLAWLLQPPGKINGKNVLLPGQWADVTDSGNHVMEHGIHRKSH